MTIEDASRFVENADERDERLVPLDDEELETVSGGAIGQYIKEFDEPIIDGN